jgi:hypothetical protein
MFSPFVRTGYVKCLGAFTPGALNWRAMHFRTILGTRRTFLQISTLSANRGQFARTTIAHQIPSIFHDGINTKHHLFPLPCTILKYRADLDFIQPRLREDSRTAFVGHPHLRIDIRGVLQEGLVMDGE